MTSMDKKPAPKPGSSPHKIRHDGAVSLAEAWLIIREWRKPDTFPWMRRKVVNWLVPRLSWVLSALSIVAHIVWAILSSCSTDFTRAGAAVTVIAAIGAALVDWHEPNAAMLDGGPVPRFRLLDPMVAIALQVALGTLIWGYGDLVPLLSRASC
jgi:hypothetical protein